MFPALLLLVFGIYARTLHPSIPGGDSGELIAAAVSDGIAHPPGYPLFTLLGQLMSRLPIGAVAARVNLLSAVCDTGAACVLYALVRRWRGDASAAFLAAGLYAFSPGIWGYATVAEVFPLNNLLVALIVYLLFRFRENRDRRWAYGGALCIGLAITNQHTSVFVSLPAIVFAVWMDPGLLREPGAAARLIGMFALGFVPYVHLPLAARRVPLITWGDPSTMDGFLDHLLRRHVGTLNLGDPNVHVAIPLPMQLIFYAKNVLIDTCGFGALLAAFGLWRRLTVDAFARWTAAAFAFYVLTFHALANLPLEYELYQGVEARFWQMPNFFVFGWLGLGFAELAVPWRRASALALALVTLQIGLHFREMDQSENRYVERHARWMLDHLAPGSLLVREGDLALFSTLCLQACENPRPDVDMEDPATLTFEWRKDWNRVRQPRVELPGTRLQEDGPPGTYGLAEFLEANARKRPVYAFGTRPLADRLPRYVPLILQRVHLPDDPISSRAWMAECLLLLPPGPTPPYSLYPESTWENQTRVVYGLSRRNLAERLVALSEKEGNDPVLADTAVRLLEEVLRVFAGAPPEFYALLRRAYGIAVKAHPGYAARAEEVGRLCEPPVER